MTDRKHKITVKRKSTPQTFKVRKDWKLATGRPTKKTPEVLEKLEYALLINCTEEEASAYAWISYDTLNKRKAEDENFRQQIQAWKKMYFYAIKNASFQRSQNIKNRDSTDILFKIDKSYSDKSEVEHKWQISLVDIAKEMQQKRLDKEKWENVK